MKATKAHKRITHAEDLISDVLERYSEDEPEIRQQLLDAKAAIGRAKDAVKLQVPARTPKKAATKRAAVNVPPVKATKKHKATIWKAEFAAPALV
jgi:hypothetical protein